MARVFHFVKYPVPPETVSALKQGLFGAHCTLIKHFIPETEGISWETQALNMLNISLSKNVNFCQGLEREL